MDSQEIIDHVKSGGVFAYPTETLWGLGADIYDEKAVENIFAIKGRELSKAVSVLVRDVHEAKKLAQVDKNIEDMLYAFWPGPVTFVLPAQPDLNKLLAPNGLIGLRCSSDGEIRQLLKQLPNPIITTSANKSGEPAALSSKDLVWLPEEVKVYRADCELKPSGGSTVILVKEDTVKCLREGDFPFEKIKSVMGRHGFSVVG